MPRNAYPGYYHHRWFLKYEDNRIKCISKNMASLYVKRDGPYEDGVESVWWEGEIKAGEVLRLSKHDYEQELRRFIE